MLNGNVCGGGCGSGLTTNMKAKMSYKRNGKIADCLYVIESTLLRCLGGAKSSFDFRRLSFRIIRAAAKAMLMPFAFSPFLSLKFFLLYFQTNFLSLKLILISMTRMFFSVYCLWEFNK